MATNGYSKYYTSSSMMIEEGRTAYYKMLDKARGTEFVRLKRGVFANPEQLADTMIDVEAIVPGGVLCLLSAWNIHGLTTSLPQAFHIAVKRGRKVTLPQYPRIELHHMAEGILHLGVEVKNVCGYLVNIYNRERCVCDAVKFRNKIGMDVCAEVIRNYLALRDRNISLLMNYAEQLRVKKSLENFIAISL